MYRWILSYTTLRSENATDCIESNGEVEQFGDKMSGIASTDCQGGR